MSQIRRCDFGRILQRQLENRCEEGLAQGKSTHAHVTQSTTSDKLKNPGGNNE